MKYKGFGGECHIYTIYIYRYICYPPPPPQVPRFGLGSDVL